MSLRPFLVAALIVIALSSLLFLAPLVGMAVVVLVAIAVPALLIFDRNTVSRQRAGPGASGPGERGYSGHISIGEEGAADHEYRRRAS